MKLLINNIRIRRACAFFCLALFSFALSGCSGGGVTLPPGPALYAGHYVGTLTATYDPRAPISGTITGVVDFTVDASGAVTLKNPYPVPPDPNQTGTGTVSADGAISASAGTISFGIRSLTGQLNRDSHGLLSGSGVITAVVQSEVAYGTWQASALPTH